MDVLDNTDCDDTDASENPTVTWYADSDGDSLEILAWRLVVAVVPQRMC